MVRWPLYPQYNERPEQSDAKPGMLRGCLAKQQTAILECAWDGQWWRRAFDDDANVVGGAGCSCGRIYLNPQSWSVIAGLGSAEQNRQAMASAHEHLDTGIGLKLLTPSYAGWYGEVGKTPIGYGPGCGENGAIFCHANTWAVIAQALLGDGNRAWEYFSQLIPANVAQKVGIDVYKAEPYAWVSNIVGPENPQFGWGNVNQITGTAPWMDVAATQYILGLRPTLSGLLIDPCVPREWKQFSMSRVYAGCKLNIGVAQDGSGARAVQSFMVNGTGGELTADGRPLIRRESARSSRELNIQIAFGK